MGELISDRDTDTSAIYRYTEARGLQPCIGGTPSNDFDGRPSSDGEVLIENLDYPVDMAFDAQGRLVIVESGTLDSFLVDGRVIRVTLP